MRKLLLVLLGLLAFAACSQTPRYAAMPMSPSRGTEPTWPDTDKELYAGVAAEDITPPPGLGIFGHGPEGRIAAGFRLRLGCEAFVFARDKDAVAFVPCDLAAPSLELQRTVAQKLVERNVPIGADRLLLMATHTHGGPAHYFGPRNFREGFSSREPGLDLDFLDWLADRIATAVQRAYVSASPACVGWVRDEVSGISRNRSVEAHWANERAPAAGATRIDARNAVDKSLFVLRVDRRNRKAEEDRGVGACDADTTRPMGLFAVFGVHNTAMPNTNDLYHGDVFGFAVREIEQRIRAAGDSPTAAPNAHLEPHELVVGIANGIEGDVSPAWDYQGASESRRLGGALADAVAKAYFHASMGGAMQAGAPLRHMYRELWFPGSAVPGKGALCPDAELGTAAAGGAIDGPTRFRMFPEFNASARSPSPVRDSCHWPKYVLMSPSGPSTKLDFPALAPISVVRIANAVLVSAPAELTTQVGLSIRESVRSVLSPSMPRAGKAGLDEPLVPIVGLTNAYLEYITTAREYQLQFYEGASNLYGENTHAFLQSHVACLARALVGGVCDLNAKAGGYPIGSVNPLAYARSPTVERLPPDPEDLPEVFEGAAPVACAQTKEGVRAWRIRFKGPPPAYVRSPERLHIEVVCLDAGRTVIDDDLGTNLEVRHDGEQWSVTWMSEHAPQCDRAEFDIRSSAFLRSAPFRVRSQGELCDP